MLAGALRLLGALVLVGGAITVGSVPPAGATPRSASGAPLSLAVTATPRPAAVTTGPGGGSVLSLLGQSTWVATNQNFSLRLDVARQVPSTDIVVVSAYPRLTNRTDFDQAADGRLGQDPGAVWIGEESVGAAPHAAAGGVWARIPVGTTLSPGDLATQQAFDPGDQSGVYPLQIQLLGADYTAVGPAISTFLVYSAGQAVFPKLDVSLTVPVAAGEVSTSASGLTSAPPAATSSTLSQLSSVLASHPGVPLTLAVQPRTAASLASGSVVDRSTLRRLSRLLRSGDELNPAPYAPVSLASLDVSGLADQIAPQLQQGRAVLRSALGVNPSTGTWVIDGPTTGATLGLLGGLGLRGLVMPDRMLSALPARLVTTTYARPTDLSDGAGPDLRVLGTDTTLASRVTQGQGAVLAADQTLAELAMIELETPSLLRGVAIDLQGLSPVPLVYLRTLLTGLQDNPFVRPVTAATLLAKIPAQPPSNLVPASGAAGGRADLAIPVRTLKPVPIPAVPAAGALQTIDRDIEGVSSLLPSDTSLTDLLRRELLTAPAPGLTTAGRQSLIDSMNGAVRAAESSVRLPGDSSVTLTSLKATLPLIVISDAKVSPHVRVVLASPKLGFHTFRPPDGTCKVEGRSSEVCMMVLHGPETALRVPVEARTSGVFSLEVTITSPDGSLILADARDTVRSTAVSSVGIVIIVVSLLFLGIWWIRNIHSGRRARQLVHRPGDIDDDDDGDGPPGGDGGPGPPSQPAGPAEPSEPRLAPPPSVTTNEPVPAVRRHRQPHAPAHRGPTIPGSLGDAPTRAREMSPSKRSTGPIHEHSPDPPQERAP